jgi:hypothetical protein
MKRLLAAILFSLTASGSIAKDACGTELCMAGLVLTGAEPAACSGPIADFFSLVKFRDGKISLYRTLHARRSFLNACESGNAHGRAQILAKFGRVIR